MTRAIENLTIKYRTLIKERMPEIETAHDEHSHYYVMNGQKYPSVTAKLQLLKDEGLMNWKMNRATEYIRERMLGLTTFQWDEASINDLIANAKLVPQKEFEGAGSIGTAVHDWRERWFSELIKGPTILPDGTFNNYFPVPSLNAEPAVISGCRAIEKFKKDTDYIPVACELFLANEELGIGGTLDDIGIMPHAEKVLVDDQVLGKGYKVKFKPRLVLVDLKTSNIGDKTQYFLQVALYYYMFKKLTGINIQEFYILHVSKTDGTYKLIPIKNIAQLVRDAKILLKLHNSLTRITEDKKKAPIII